MAKQLGRALLVKIYDGVSAYDNLCGLNSKSITINNSAIDVTTPDCTTPGGALWTETLAGVKSVSVSGDGFFEDSTQEGTLAALALADDNTELFEIVVPGLGTYAGTFRLTSFDFGGETEGGVTYSLSLESTGAVTFT